MGTADVGHLGGVVNVVTIRHCFLPAEADQDEMLAKREPFRE